MNGEHKLAEPSESLQALLEKLAASFNYKQYDVNILSKFNKGENYVGEIQRASIKGVKQNGEEETLKFIAKTAPVDPALRKQFGITFFFEREIYAYQVLMKELDELQSKYNIPENEMFAHAKCYITSMEEFKEALIFEDLNAKGFQLYDRLKSLDYEHLMLVVKTIARYHALSFAAKHKLPKETYRDFMNHVSTEKDMGDTFTSFFNEMSRQALECLDNESDKNKLSKYVEGDMNQKYMDMVNISDNPKDDPYFIITHGDCWVNNMLFKYENDKPSEIILVDWQILKYCSPITDLTYLVFCCTDEDIRTERWDEIFDTYFDALKTRLSELDCDPDKVYPEDVYREDVKNNLEFGLLMGILVIPFVLSSRDNAINLTDMIDGQDEFQPSAMKPSDLCKERVRGLIRHFAKLQVI